MDVPGGPDFPHVPENQHTSEPETSRGYLFPLWVEDGSVSEINIQPLPLSGTSLLSLGRGQESLEGTDSYHRGRDRSLLVLSVSFLFFLDSFLLVSTFDCL